ncbi:MAG: hypothetical protein HWE08_01775 [Alphaproteobacteria bacterium]|nr:hypothetical protein [Alphaproteobacteria bacterium]
MNTEEKYAVLSKLAHTRGEAAEKLLKSEHDRIRGIFQSETKYFELEEALELLKAFVFQFPEEAAESLTTFIDRMSDIEVTANEGRMPLHFDLDNPNLDNVTLQVRATHVLGRLKYLNSEAVCQKLVTLLNVESKRLLAAIGSELEQIAALDLDAVFMEGVEVAPQLVLIDLYEKMTDEQLVKHSEIIQSCLDKFLASTLNATRGGADTITLTSASIPALGTVGELRARSINLAERQYPLEETLAWKTRLLNTLQQATQLYTQRRPEDDVIQMVANNTVQVLSFMRQLLDYEPLAIVQKIEHDAFWIFYHAISPDVEAAALEIEKAISLNKEYQYYRDLVGYEGIFGSWGQHKKERYTRDLSGKEREARVQALAETVNADNFEDWSNRILSYMDADGSDLATYQLLYDFVAKVAQQLPVAMLEFLDKHHQKLAPIQIAIMRGLWASQAQSGLKKIMQDWANKGLNLYSCTKVFLSIDEPDLDLLREIWTATIKTKDIQSLTVMISVVSHLTDQGNHELVESYFSETLALLSDLNESNWPRNIWVSRDIRKLVPHMKDTDIDALLANQLLANKVDSYSEETLAPIAKRFPEKVLQYFSNRIEKAKEIGDRKEYEALPFRLYKLGEALAPHHAALIAAARSWYEKTRRGSFVFNEAHFLSNIYPSFKGEFEKELFALVRGGKRDDIEFVICVLRAYEGQAFLHPIAQEIVAQLPSDDELIVEVEIALSANGVVMGEYGMSNAYQSKAEGLKLWLESDNANILRFATNLIAQLEQRAKSEKQRADEEMAIRKAQYGELE